MVVYVDEANPEEQILTVTSAAQTEGAANHVHFSLEHVDGARFPEGAYIDPDSGQIHWAPAVGYYTFRVRIRDEFNTADILVHIRVVRSTEPAAWTETDDWHTAIEDQPISLEAPTVEQQPADARLTFALGAVATIPPSKEKGLMADRLHQRNVKANCWR